MVTWQKLESSSDAARWQNLLFSAGDANPFQSYAWGEYKRSYGWEPERWLGRDEAGRTLACLQSLKKGLPLGRVLVWVPGGPVTRFSDAGPRQTGGLMRTWLAQFRNGNSLAYMRLRSHAAFSEEEARGLGEICARPSQAINSGWTIHVDLSRTLDELRAAMTSKHRYYVKQSEKAGINWKWGNSEALTKDTILLYEDMCRVKAIGSAAFSAQAISELGQKFDKDCGTLVGYLNGAPVTACLVLKTGKTAFYLLAATGFEGRKVSAAYAMVWRLFETLRSEGIRLFDFGGIDPASPAAKGVDHFKRGFGGTAVEYLGEWEWAPSALLRWGANFMIKRRKNL